MASPKSAAAPVPTILAPWLNVRGSFKALEFYKQAFGAVEVCRHEGGGGVVARLSVSGAEFWLSDESPEHQNFSPQSIGGNSARLILTVSDPDAIVARALREGAKEVYPVSEGHGWRVGRVVDPFGHHWEIGRPLDSAGSRPETATADRQVSLSRLPQRSRPSFCYLEIPALDVHKSADFYEKVFGWNIRKRDTDRPSFDDAAGNISGAWVTGRPPATATSLLPYVWVDDIAATLRLAESHGATIAEPPHPDHPHSTSQIATFHDPAGNRMGLYQEAEQ
jgi:PhnB protein